jgi:hypothetical protein
MRLPRMTTRQMMVGVVLVAVHCAAYRTFVKPLSRADVWPWPDSLWIGLLPSLDVLTVAACLAIGQLDRKGEVRPFLVGFEAFGWAASVAFVAAMLGCPESMTSYERWAVWGLRWFWFHYVTITGYWSHDHWNLIWGVFTWIALSLPQLLFAVLGGRIADRSHLVVTRGSPSPEKPEGRPMAFPVRKVKVIVMVAGSLSVVVVLGAAMKERSERFREMSEMYARNEESYIRGIKAAGIAEAYWRALPHDWVMLNGLDPRERIDGFGTHLATMRREAEYNACLLRKFRSMFAITRRPTNAVKPSATSRGTGVEHASEVVLLVSDRCGRHRSRSTTRSRRRIRKRPSWAQASATGSTGGRPKDAPRTGGHRGEESILLDVLRVVISGDRFGYARCLCARLTRGLEAPVS